VLRVHGRRAKITAMRDSLSPKVLLTDTQPAIR
jgi:hypothetical protein